MSDDKIHSHTSTRRVLVCWGVSKNLSVSFFSRRARTTRWPARGVEREMMGFWVATRRFSLSRISRAFSRDAFRRRLLFVVCARSSRGTGCRWTLGRSRASTPNLSERRSRLGERDETSRDENAPLYYNSCECTSWSLSTREFAGSRAWAITPGRRASLAGASSSSTRPRAGRVRSFWSDAT